jgi:hypothetical protein
VIRLEGRRIVLRDWRPDETEAMHRWLGNALVTRYLSWGARTLHDSARHLRECIHEQKKPHRTRFFLAIQLKESGLVIGDAGFQWTSTAREGRVDPLDLLIAQDIAGCAGRARPPWSRAARTAARMPATERLTRGARARSLAPDSGPARG